MSAVYWISFLLLITVSMLIRAEFKENHQQRVIFKPLSTTLLVVIILISMLFDDGNLPFKAAILLGMIFCFGGDVALMYDSKKAFLIGLVLFLIGHIVYGVTLVIYNGFVFKGYLSIAVVVLVGLPIFAYLYSGLGGMKIPVICYMVVISLMLNSALLTFESPFFNSSQAWLLAVGAALFYLSDIVLAINKFKKPFELNRLSLYLYYAGQLGIALSTMHFIKGA
ncbi:MAG: lysoplasmalogenase [Deltaproteobacteria bacterium]|jgi:uncharacterized membrane protein YhhN|nr:lysoplasmalogenase [Deltaproteobacteria bacterium]MBT4637990.1 lysoplasmalogenase [Deltaproteobacteria bacterium]MBT6501040.1 lysoplasmalogenase [Deltaproteobacteria bacterium]MBT6612818.1 lysoplasmalogenase [Deltaproteobacteria bacterium]MBT7715416.1 lysoplasmalogenase [Deltaproteobacteria bacterium]